MDGENNLTAQERAALAAAVHTAAGEIERLKDTFREVLHENYDIRAVREAMLTLMFITGAPRVINGLIALSEVCGELGREYPEFHRDTLPGGPDEHRRTGEGVMRRIYGERYEAFAHRMESLDGEFWSWLQGDAYGKCLGRPGIEFRLRDLAIVSVLVALDWPLQLVTHLNGALNLGTPPGQIEDTLRLVEQEGYDTSGARKVWEKVKRKRLGNG